MAVRVELSTMSGCIVCYLVTSGEDVFCSAVFGTLVGVSMFYVIWSELLMTSAISFLYGHQYTSAREWSVREHLR